MFLLLQRLVDLGDVDPHLRAGLGRHVVDGLHAVRSSMWKMTCLPMTPLLYGSSMTSTHRFSRKFGLPEVLEVGLNGCLVVRHPAVLAAARVGRRSDVVTGRSRASTIGLVDRVSHELRRSAPAAAIRGRRLLRGRAGQRLDGLSGGYGGVSWRPTAGSAAWAAGTSRTQSASTPAGSTDERTSSRSIVGPRSTMLLRTGGRSATTPVAG